MLTLSQLWLPTLAAALAVFFASSLIHMVLKYHNSDYRKTPNEDEVRAALKPVAAAPGMYFVPHMLDHKELKKPENVQKFVDGPVAMMTIRRPAPPSMGAPLAQWFALTLFVSIVCAYVVSHTVPSGASFLAICRPVATVTFMSFAVGALSNGIWYGRPWIVVAKELVDAVIYAVVAAVTFAALWPGTPAPA